MAEQKVLTLPGNAIVGLKLEDFSDMYRDAIRYQYLKEHAHPGTDFLEAMRFNNLDAAIDSAIALQRSENQ